jgi:hypothetical protein
MTGWSRAPPGSGILSIVLRNWSTAILNDPAISPSAGLETITIKFRIQSEPTFLTSHKRPDHGKLKHNVDA